MPLLSRRRLYTRSNAALYVPAVGGGGGGGGGTVLFDSSSGATLSASGTTATFNLASGGLSLNVGSGANGTTNRALVVALFFPSSAAGTITSPTGSWDGVPLTFLGGPYTGGGNSDMFLFGMTAPALGTKDLVFNWTGSAVAGVMTLSVVGALQIGGSSTFHGIATNTGTSAISTVTVGSALANEITMAAFMNTSVFTTTTKTVIGTNGAAAISSFAACWTRSAAPVMDFSNSPSAPFAAVGVAIVGA